MLAALLEVQPLLPQTAKFTINTNVVIVNVTVLDRNGKPIENLTKEDFLVYEDGKLQRLQAVDLQKLNDQILPPPDQVLAPEQHQEYSPAAEASHAKNDRLSRYQDRRLMILFFDFGSMQPAEQIRPGRRPSSSSRVK